jgi:ribosomal protein L1
LLTVEQALAKVKDLAYAKFDESVDVSLNLGINALKGDQGVRDRYYYLMVLASGYV